jgi:hypothetical protein
MVGIENDGMNFRSYVLDTIDEMFDGRIAAHIQLQDPAEHITSVCLAFYQGFYYLPPSYVRYSDDEFSDIETCDFDGCLYAEIRLCTYHDYGLAPKISVAVGRIYVFADGIVPEHATVLASLLRGHARNAPKVLQMEADLVGVGLGDIYRRNLNEKFGLPTGL